MATIKPREGKRGKTYEVRWVDPDGNRQTQTFKKWALANDFKNSVEAAKGAGTYVHPRAERAPAPVVHTVGTLALTVLDSKPDPNTLAWYRNMLRHVEKRWGDVPVADVTFLDVQAWITKMGKDGVGPPTVRGAFIVLHEVMKTAMQARLVSYDPCIGIKKPRLVRREMLFLSRAQVELLADAMEEAWPGFGWGTLVQFAAYSGARAGEIGGLRVKHLDLLHHRVRITVARKAYGVDGDTKTHKGRWIGLPDRLCDELAAQIKGKGPEDRVWTGDRGGPLDHHWFYERRFKPVVKELSGASYLPVLADEDGEAPTQTLRFHDLRHTCVALLIAKGNRAEQIMSHLGHSTIKTTYDTYGHLLPPVLEEIRASLNATWDEAQSEAEQLKADRRKHLRLVRVVNI